MNFQHVAHIIRDVFKETSFTVCYEEEKKLSSILWSSEHGIGAFSLWSGTSAPAQNEDNRYYWPAGMNGMFFGDNCVDLFVSINYNPTLFDENSLQVAEEIKRVLKPKAFIFACNPGLWADNLNKLFFRNKIYEKEIKKYSLFSKENVLVYENI